MSLAQEILRKHIADRGEVINNDEIIKRKELEIQKLRRKLDGYMEMRSEGEISREVFREKNEELSRKFSVLEKDINRLYAEEELNSQETIDCQKKLDLLKDLLYNYVNVCDNSDIPENVVEAFVKEIRVSKNGFEWYLRTDGSLHSFVVKGRKKQTGEIIESASDPPSCNLIDRNTGSYQRNVILHEFVS